MSDVLITYDIAEELFEESKHTEVKDAMKELGYNDRFSTTDKQEKKTTYYLPNTTLWKKNGTTIEAKTDLLKVAKEKKADVERLIATEFTNDWEAIPGKPYKSK